MNILINPYKILLLKEFDMKIYFTLPI